MRVESLVRAVLILLLGLFCALVSAAEAPLRVERLPAMPAAVSNNAVALVQQQEGGPLLITAAGLTAGKSWRDTTDQAWRTDGVGRAWTALARVPGGQGRLASSAVAVAGQVYLLGGYTVARDGTEVSTPEVFRLNLQTGGWSLFSRMPVPVDDAVALVHDDRYIYLLSGWHDLGNVNLVQVLDSHDASWSQATPWPGVPVFGHAGAIHAGTLVVCDGVRVDYPADGAARQFLAADACWLGQIDAQDHRRIAWRPLPPHPGKARYRMAAGSDADGGLWFVGGSVNPYNFDGIGYDGVPARPESAVFSFDLADSRWRCHGNLPEATMDHRGLPWHDGWFYVLGGMRQKQVVSDGFFRFRPAPEQPCFNSAARPEHAR